jgi:hypothetical protein
LDLSLFCSIPTLVVLLSLAFSIFDRRRLLYPDGSRLCGMTLCHIRTVVLIVAIVEIIVVVAVLEEKRVCALAIIHSKRQKHR